MSVSVSRPQITARISDLVKKHIDPNNDPRIYWAKEVTFDYASEHSIRVDFMRYKPVNNSVSGIEKGDFYCYEVKSSEEDFHSKNGHNFIGDFNYYVMPEDVYENVKKLIPWDVGVYVPDDSSLHCIKKARRKNRTRPISVMLLMMWRSSRREIVSIRRQEREKQIDKELDDAFEKESDAI